MTQQRAREGLLEEPAEGSLQGRGWGGWGGRRKVEGGGVEGGGGELREGDRGRSHGANDCAFSTPGHPHPLYLPSLSLQERKEATFQEAVFWFNYSVKMPLTTF